ncbi:MAG: cbb3-type cytochrome oxidase assembly protein CcoS [Planctomycetota bacterium]
MSVVFVMAPVALLLAGIAVLAFVWAARDGQMDDVDTPPHRALFDDTPVEDGANQQAADERNVKRGDLFE